MMMTVVVRLPWQLMLMWLLLVSNAHHYTHATPQGTSQSEDAPVDPESSSTARGGRNGRPSDTQREEIKVPQEVRSPASSDVPQQSDVRVWTMKGPQSPAETPGKDQPKKRSPEYSSWAPVDGEDQAKGQNARTLSVTGRGGSGHSMDGDKNTFWISRGKKAIEDYIPYYWGSNQNLWGSKIPSRGWITPRELLQSTGITETQQENPQEPHRASSNWPVRSYGWESNQNLWGRKRDSPGPFWISRGKRSSWNLDSKFFSKKKNDGVTYWIARGKKKNTESPEGPWIRSAGVPEEENTADDSAPSWSSSAGDAFSKRPDHSFWIARGRREDEGNPPPERSWETTKQSQGEEDVDSHEVPPWDEDSVEVFRKRRSGGDGGHYWISRGKKLAVPPPQPNLPLWPNRGRKSTDLLNTFWYARGKKEESHRAPFWIARGKKDVGGSDRNPFWIARGKKRDDGSHGDTFWVARGKKHDTGNNSIIPFWISRGKKEAITAAPFWAMRGKKEEDHPLWAPSEEDKGKTHLFWTARGKKNEGKHHFWVVRGKKEGDKNVFWVVRGKKEGNRHPFWVARGKKNEKSADAQTFWVARGKKHLKPAETDPAWEGTEARTPFWAARGKRRFGTDVLPSEVLNTDDDDDDEDRVKDDEANTRHDAVKNDDDIDGSRDDDDTSLHVDTDNNQVKQEPIMAYLLQTLLASSLNNTQQQQHQQQDPRSQHDSTTQLQNVNYPFVKDFVALTD